MTLSNELLESIGRAANDYTVDDKYAIGCRGLTEFVESLVEAGILVPAPEFSPEEESAITELCQETELSRTAVLRQGLRIYQAVHKGVMRLVEDWPDKKQVSHPTDGAKAERRKRTAKTEITKDYIPNVLCYLVEGEGWYPNRRNQPDSVGPQQKCGNECLITPTPYRCQLFKGHEGNHWSECDNAQFSQEWPQIPPNPTDGAKADVMTDTNNKLERADKLWQTYEEARVKCVPEIMVEFALSEEVGHTCGTTMQYMALDAGLRKHYFIRMTSKDRFGDLDRFECACGSEYEDTEQLREHQFLHLRISLGIREEKAPQPVSNQPDSVGPQVRQTEWESVKVTDENYKGGGVSVADSPKQERPRCDCNCPSCRAKGPHDHQRPTRKP